MERRYHEPPPPGLPLAIPCRHCAMPNVLDASQMDITQGRAWAKCGTCEDWFLVRWEDAVALGVVKPVDAIEVTD